MYYFARADRAAILLGDILSDTSCGSRAETIRLNAVVPDRCSLLFFYYAVSAELPTRLVFPPGVRHIVSHARLVRAAARSVPLWG